MRRLNENWLRVGLWLVVVGAIVGGLIWVRIVERREMEKVLPWLKLERQHDEAHANEKIKLAQQLSQSGFKVITNPPPAVIRREEMSPDQREKLARNYQEKYLPLARKWFAAYEGRLPFDLDDFKLETFHSCLGGYMYTFMIGDTTFTIQDSPKLGLKVSYLMTRQEAVQMNSLPKPGFVPNLTVPVTREEVIRMVKADAGVEFTPHEILIKPTAASCTLNGGAFVDILPAGKDPNNGLNYKISMVFNAAGKLVNYVRDPFF